MTTIETNFPIIQNPFDKESYLKGEYSDKLQFSDYLLLNWRNNTYIIETPESSHKEAVFPPHPESAYISSLIPHPKRNQKYFLDVGVGSGILSIDAAKKGWKTIGVDINPKAIKIASINAKLNDVQCKFQIDNLAKNQNENFFDFCIANLPFEPTPSGKLNFTHSDGGVYGDKLIKEFIPIVENLMKTDGFVILPSFSLFKNDESDLEKHLKGLNKINFSKAIIRLSQPLELSLLSSRFENSRDAYKYLTKEGYSHFVIDVGLLKKTNEESGFIGILDRKDIADRSWIMPLVRNSFKKVKQ